MRIFGFTIGIARVLLTYDTGEIINIHVDWSPDGMQIAFASNGTGDYGNNAMNADGSNIRQLTDSPGRDIYPTWSPDSRMLAFATNRDGNWEIYMMNADGSNQTNLTNNPADDTQPDWGLQIGAAKVYSKCDPYAIGMIAGAPEPYPQPRGWTP